MKLLPDEYTCPACHMPCYAKRPEPHRLEWDCAYCRRVTVMSA